LTVPPLRDRREDIPALAEHFLRFFEAAQGRVGLSFSAAALATLQMHSWPGNLRELRNTIERAVIFSSASTLEPHDLGLGSLESTTPTVHVGAEVSLEELEREHIARVIAGAATLESAARTLGIDATTLSRKRKRYGLS
jgi:NtrC-family two-component system response regulator AlgB